jgi:PST family polysaccharide transporter
MSSAGTPNLADENQPVLASGTPSSSYRQIIKSSTLIGGSSIISILLGIVRTKFLAILVGPTGFGFVGTYTSITSAISALAGMGLNNSGVRQIAEAAGTGEEATISRTATALRRITVLLGAGGALLLIILCRPISLLAFKSREHVGALAFLSISVFCTVVAGSQSALVQGMRRVADLARLNVLGASLGTVLSIPVLWFFGQRGLVPFMVTVAAMTMLASWWYARKIQIARIHLSWRQTATEARALFRLGFVFMASGLMGSLVALAARVIILRKVDVAATGQYHCAWTFSTFYVSFILQAMGADFFPRLTASANDDNLCRRLINEQIEVGLLLAAPGILATLSFSPLVIGIFFTGEFGPAIEILRWQILGVLLRVVTWPMGYLLAAKGNARLFFWSEALLGSLHVALIWLGVQYLGLVGAGVAFFALYLVYFGVMSALLRKLIGFSWSRENARVGLLVFPATAVVFLAIQFLPQLWGLAVAGSVTLLVGLLCFRWFCQVASPTGFRGLVTILRSRVGL